MALTQNEPPESLSDRTYRVLYEPEVDLSIRDRLKPLIVFISMNSTIVGVSYWLSIGGHWKYDDKSDQHYLDSRGLGMTLWLGLWIMFAGTAVVSTFGTRGQTTLVADEMSAPAMDKTRGLGGQELDDVFGPAPNTNNVIDGVKHLGTERAMTIAVSIGQMIFNFVSINQTFKHLPVRDPAEPLNEAQHLVSWFEVGTLYFLTCYSLVIPFLISTKARDAIVKGLIKFIQLKRKQGARDICGKMRYAWSMGGKFSALLSFRYINFETSASDYKRSKKERGFGVAVSLIVTRLCFWMPLAAFALLIRVKQVSFVTHDLWWDWTFVQWVHLGGFLNNVAGICPNQAQVKINMLFDYFDRDVQRGDAWMSELMEKLMERSGFHGLLVFLTVTPEDVCKLLNANNRHHKIHDVDQADGSCCGKLWGTNKVDPGSDKDGLREPLVSRPVESPT